MNIFTTDIRQSDFISSLVLTKGRRSLVDVYEAHACKEDLA